MKIQLSKTKTIEVAWPGAGQGKSRPADVVGVEIGGARPQGCPAVRIARTKSGAWRLVAAGFVPPPGEMPANENDIVSIRRWSLPKAFRAPAAALVVDSPRAFARMTTLEAIAAAPVPVEAAASKESAAPRVAKKLGVKREAPASAAAASAAPAAPIQVEPGVTTVHAGMRFMVRPFGEGALVFQTGLPNCQAAWAAQLLPEGHRPTACSIQSVPAALLSALYCQPGFKADGGNGVALFVTETSAFYAGYRDGTPVLFGECPGAGAGSIRATVKDRFGIEDALVDSFLEDGFFEPGEMLEPIVRPALHQLRTTLDYIMGRHRVPLSRVYLLGVSAGANHWSRLAEAVLRFPLSVPDIFEGLEAPTGKNAAPAFSLAQSQVFAGALGAALSAGEGES